MAKQPAPPLTYGNGANVVQPSAGTPIDAQAWADSGQWVEVTSSNVAGIKYDKASQTLSVEFLGPKQSRNNTTVYEYYGVSEFTAMDMFRCSSMGAVHSPETQ